MTPAALRAESFAHYPAAGRVFAVRHLALLQRLPLPVCPLFLREVQRLETSFPAEGESLRVRCDFLQGLDEAAFAARMSELRGVRLSRSLEMSDWVNDPSRFLRELTAYLWSSGQMDLFRAGSRSLLAGIEMRPNDTTRLTIVMAGAGVRQPQGELFRKLRRRGILLTGLESRSMPQQIAALFRTHARKFAGPYQNWYVDGGDPLKLPLTSDTIVVSYTTLNALRRSILGHMEKFIADGRGGAEEMRDSLSSLSPQRVNAGKITGDPILQRFYTELFTESSGPQIFSTSFVQWTGRELARRAEPASLMLRYVPRQKEKSFDDLIQKDSEDTSDPEGSLRDAEMGAYYNLLDMERITAPGKGVFLLWIEGTSTGVLVGPNAPAGAQTDSFTHLDKAFEAFT